jgi:hypothetical protein
MNNLQIINSDPGGEFPWLIAGIVAAFTYIYNAYNNGDQTRDENGHQHRNYDLGAWAWNPTDWFKKTPGNPNPGIVVTVGGNTDGSDLHGSIAAGNLNMPMPTIGYSSNQGWGFGYSHNGNSNLYYPSYNYNAPEQAAEKGYNEAFGAWQFYAGLGAAAASEIYFSETFGTWMGKNGKFYDRSWSGNQYTGGKYKFAKSMSDTFRYGGYVAGAWNAYSLNEQRTNGEIDNTQFVLEEVSNVYSTIGGIYGAAWSVGWETGRYVAQQSWYQRTKFSFWYNIWQMQHGKPSYKNRYDWEYFFNNYKP